MAAPPPIHRSWNDGHAARHLPTGLGEPHEIEPGMKGSALAEHDRMEPRTQCADRALGEPAAARVVDREGGRLEARQAEEDAERAARRVGSDASEPEARGAILDAQHRLDAEPAAPTDLRFRDVSGLV